MSIAPLTANAHGMTGALSFNAFRAVLAALLILGTGILALATRWGIGLYPDSIVYVGAARNLLAGHGFQFLNDIGELAPITQYPPGYPWLLAVFAWFGLDALEAARWGSIGFSAGNSILAGYLAHRSTRSYGATLIAVFLSFAAFPMVYVNTQALSEPPFIFLILLGCCFLARYLQEAERVWLYLFALAIGMSCMVRYVGVAFGMTGALVIFLHGRSAWRQRFADAAIFSIVAALPIVTWVVGNYLRAGNAVNRTFGFHLPGLSDLLPSLDTAAHWFLPSAIVDSLPWPSRIVLLTVFLVFFCLARHLDWSNSWYPRLLIYCVVGYAAFLFISFSFNDQPLYFDTRTLALPYLALMIVALTIVTEWLRKKRSKGKSWRWFGFDCALVLLAALQMINGAIWLQLSYASGIGFSTESWRRSELIAFAKRAPATAPVVSNAPDFIYTLTARRAAMIPHKLHPWTRQPNEDYAKAVAAMSEQLKQPAAALLYFNDEDRLWYLPSIKELAAILPLEKVTNASDGAVYRINGAGIGAAK